MKILVYRSVVTSQVLALPARIRLLLMFIALTSLLASLLSSTVLFAAEFENDYVPPSSTVRILGGELHSTISKSASLIASRFNIEQQNASNSALHFSLAIPQSSAGSSSSITDLIKGRAEFAIVSADVANELYRSPKKWGMEGITERVRLVSAVAPSLLHVVVRKTDQTKLTLADIKNKKISIGFHSAMLDYTIKELLHAYGIDINGSNVHHYPIAQAISLLDEDKLDAVFILDQAPSVLVSRLLGSNEYTLLPVHSEFLLKEQHTSVAHGLNEVRAPYYPGLDNDFVTVLQDNYLLAHRAISDSTVRSIKALSDDFISEIPSLIPLHESLSAEDNESSANLHKASDSTEVPRAKISRAKKSRAKVSRSGYLRAETGEQP